VYFVRFVQRHDKKGKFKQAKTAENQEKNVLPEKTGRFAGKKIPPAAF
jgi:hypothetical protein